MKATEKIAMLDSRQIRQKIERLAYQVLEDNVEEKEIILAGIIGNGYLLAERLAAELKKISSLSVQLVRIEMDKKAPIKSGIVLSPPDVQFENKIVVVVDDVLESGRTLIYGLRPFLDLPIKKIRTVVLADRNHKRFPVSADFTGISLATTLQDRITVVLDAGKECAWLD